MTARHPPAILDAGSLTRRFPYECWTSYSYWEVVQWVEDYVGTFDQEWYRHGGAFAGADPGLYRFRDQQAAVMFALRWS
jgi:hypothetical protein